MEKAAIAMMSALTPLLVGWLTLYRPTASAGMKSQEAQWSLGKQLAEERAERQQCHKELIRCVRNH